MLLREIPRWILLSWPFTGAIRAAETRRDKVRELKSHGLQQDLDWEA